GALQSINTVYQDPRGDLLVTALNGRLFRVLHQTLVPMQLASIEGRLPVRNAFRDSTGALWLGTDGQGVARIADARVTRYTMRQGLTNDFIRAFCEDRDGSIWIGTDGGLSRWHSGVFKTFDIADGLVYRSIRALLLDRSGNLWIATDGGLSRFQNGAFVVDPRLDRLRGRKIWALYEDPGGALWIGTRGSGLFLLDGSDLRQFTTAEGLPSNKIHFITEDVEGNLWMTGPSGIVSIAKRDLVSQSSSSGGPLAMRVYTTAEGLSTNQMTGGVQPAGALTSSGELWFPSTRGAVRVEPAVPDRRSAWPVLIEQLLADDQDIPLSADVRLAPGEGKLEIHYTAIRLRSPERTRFKYQMEGFDRDWTDAGQRRIAYYTNLPPGHYRFRVLAYEVNDPANAAEHVLSVELQPHFHQTGWFLALCALAVTTAGWGLYWLHVRNIRKRFVAVLEERNRLAREMHDTLIQGCIGVSALLEAASRAQDVSSHISSELLDRARDEVRSAVDDARRAVWELRQGSGDGDQLVAAVSQLAQRTGLESGVAVHFQTSGTPMALGADGGRSLLLIIREALQNAVRHAAPKNVNVVLSFEKRALRLMIDDDGCGFDPTISDWADGRHYGLVGMRERVEKLGGDFALTSAPGKGTQILLSIPRRKGLPFGSHKSFRRLLPRLGLRNSPR
ncbi:MAG TPA: two-component regulator propeller domain-containing protein, partial [Blastocatellia bacterium]|nr:two-component regulator propeller domain-containing protein [Blastocatellia bacterium]